MNDKAVNNKAVEPSQEDRTDVKVFENGPEWDELNGKPWFFVRNPRLLARFSVLDAKFSDGLSAIRREYPDCVLIY